MSTADVLAFIKAQREPRRGSGSFASRTARADWRRARSSGGWRRSRGFLIPDHPGRHGVAQNPVPRGLAMRRPGHGRFAASR